MQPGDLGDSDPDLPDPGPEGCCSRRHPLSTSQNFCDRLLPDGEPGNKNSTDAISYEVSPQEEAEWGLGERGSRVVEVGSEGVKDGGPMVDYRNYREKGSLQGDDRADHCFMKIINSTSALNRYIGLVTHNITTIIYLLMCK